MALPWWVGVLAGTLACLLVGVLIPAVVASEQSFADAALATMPVAAILLVAGLSVSALRLTARGASGWFSRSNSVSALLRLPLESFTRLSAEAFRRRGYTVVESGAGGTHVGVDLVLLKAGRMYFVRSRHWRVFQIDAGPLRELRALMDANDVPGGYFITAGVFTRDARVFAAGAEIELIGGSQLLAFLHTDRAHAPLPPMPEPVFVSSTALTVPVCPSCRSPMSRRTARYGKNAGEEFWGCPNYPKCKGTRMY